MTSNNKPSFDELLKEAEDFIGFKTKEEKLGFDAKAIQLDIMHAVQDFMDKEGMSRQKLAAKLNKSKSFISQLFSCDKSLNLKMIAQMQEILGCKFQSSFTIDSVFNNKIKYTKDDYGNEGYNKMRPIYNITDGELRAA